MGADRALGILLLMLSVAEIVVGQADTTVKYGEKCDMPCNPPEICGNSTRQVCNTTQNLQCSRKNHTCSCKDKYFTPDRSECISETSLDKELTFQFDFRTHLTLNVTLSTTYRNVKISRVHDCDKCPTTQHKDGGYVFNLGNLTAPYSVSLTITDAHGGTFIRNFSVSPIIAKNFTENDWGAGHITVTWNLDHPVGSVKLAGCMLEETQKDKIGICSCTNVSCELTNLKQDTKYTMHVKLKNSTSEITQVTTYVYPLNYTRNPEAVIDSANWTKGPFRANVTVTEKAGGVVGAYVINITSVKQSSPRCVKFRRNDACDEVDSLGCEKSNALDKLDSAPSPDTTMKPTTTITGTNSSKDEEMINRVRMSLSNLQPLTEYNVSVTPWYCNVTHVQANSSVDTITTKPIGDVISVDLADKTNVTVNWFIPESPPNMTMVNYSVTINDFVGKLQNNGTCVSAVTNVDPVKLCSVQHAVSGNFSCSGSVEDLYDFWEYEANVIASYRGVATSLTSHRFETVPGMPGKATELEYEVNCSNGKPCVSWKDPCPRDRRGFIDHYVFQLTLEGQNQIIRNKNYTSHFQEYLSSKNNAGYRQDNNREPYRDSDHIQPGKSYTIKITPYTSDHKPGSTESLTITINITERPKMPTTEELKKLIPDSNVSAGEHSLAFLVTNTSFITNRDNGEVTKKGMIVVKNSKGEQFHHNDTAAHYDELPNAAKSEGGPYRVDFSDRDLRDKGAGATVTLGDNDPSCDHDSTKFCDPKLETDTSYTVYVFSCNAVLCAKIPAVNKKKTGSGKQGQGKNKNSSIIGPEIIGVLVLGVTAWVAIAFLAYFMCFRKRRQRPISELDSGSGGIFYAMRPRNTRPMLLLDLETVVAKKQRDEGLLLREEYDEVKNGDVNYPTDASLLDTNKPKNRFGDVMAFDHTRVKLSPDSQGGDYINANYIPGYSRENEYIATQGPLHSTMDDFWRMVWEHRASIIVMLTQTVERGQVKCEMYWPATHGEVRQYGDVIVTNTSVSNLNEFTITIFTLRHAADDKQELEVMHFHYLKWPDMTADVHVKSMAHFVSFVRQYVKPNRSCPMVVHCSAGIGRTGTYISIDYVMQFTQERPINDHLDIFSFIVKIRKARCRMVQTAGQYILIHQCARHLMAARRRRDLELKEGSSGRGTPHPVANGESPPPLVNNRAKSEKVAAAHGDRGEETDSADELSQNDTAEMETALYENLMAGAPSDARLDTLRQEDEATSGNPLATSSMEQLYRP